MGKNSVQAVQGLFREDLGVQGPGNRKGPSALIPRQSHTEGEAGR